MKDFSEYLANPDLLDEISEKDIREWIEQYPYVHNLYFLLDKKLSGSPGNNDHHLPTVSTPLYSHRMSLFKHLIYPQSGSDSEVDDSPKVEFEGPVTEKPEYRDSSRIAESENMDDVEDEVAVETKPEGETVEVIEERKGGVGEVEVEVEVEEDKVEVEVKEESEPSVMVGLQPEELVRPATFFPQHMKKEAEKGLEKEETAEEAKDIDDADEEGITSRGITGETEVEGGPEVKKYEELSSFTNWLLSIRSTTNYNRIIRGDIHPGADHNTSPEKKDQSLDDPELFAPVKEKKKKKKELKKELQKKKKEKKKKRKKEKGQNTGKSKDKLTDLADESIARDEYIVSEALAELLFQQKHYEEAIKMYQKLSLIFPEKSTYFAAQIEKINNKR